MDIHAKLTNYFKYLENPLFMAYNTNFSSKE